MYANSFSSLSKYANSVSDSDSESEVFDERHNINSIFEPEIERDKIVISVIDTGIGIKNRDRVKLFKLFGTL